ncbi:metal-sulfur cluster assembly factor [Chloroflexus sp.]|uniref:metal-sulfur cluster assembly factor n=1 Tax=Chloroflexus sp. TaxID=1904827 RepID=UPI002ACEC29C|nr:metal-sulfur cluster assembly factor [Chloroflexus sp.]
MADTATAGIGHDDVMAVLRQCYDPCCKERQVSVVDMGLVEQIRINGPQVDIDIILTTGWCPFAWHLLQMMEEEVKTLPGVEQVQVNITWDTPWSPERMSALARERLRLPLEQLLPLREARRQGAQQEGAP